MDLDLDLDSSPLIGEIHFLSEEDSSSLRAASRPPATVRLRANHHAIARLLAAGVRPVEISERLGVSQTTLSLLGKSPPFRELLSEYQAEAAQHTFDLRERLELAAALSTERLLELLAEGEELDPNFLRRTMVDLLDRTGYPAVKQINSFGAHVGLSSKDISLLKERYRNASSQNGSSEGIPAAQSLPENLPADRMGEIVPLFSSRPDEADGSAGEGEGV